MTNKAKPISSSNRAESFGTHLSNNPMEDIMMPIEEDPILTKSLKGGEVRGKNFPKAVKNKTVDVGANPS